MVKPYSTREVDDSSVVQVIVAPLEVIFIAWTLEIVGGVVSGGGGGGGWVVKVLSDETAKLPAESLDLTR